MKLLAHLTNDDGRRREQSLKEHCFHVAEYAGESIGSARLYHTVYLAALLHDAGKAKAEFTEYLERANQGEEVQRGTVNHTFAGVIWLMEKYHGDLATKWERLTCEIIAYAVGAHHGMFDCTDLEGKNGFLYRLQKDRDEICYKEAIGNYFSQVAEGRLIDEYFPKAVREVEAFFGAAKGTYGSQGGGKIFFQISMLVRLTLSAVIYGDRRDTSEFMEQGKPCRTQEKGWKKRREYYEEKIAGFDDSSLLNRVRKDISRQCLEAAERPSGIYRLNVPTGAGKTLCTLRYALAHAERYDKKRIIFIIPLLSILDQNVSVIQNYVPNKDEVLEHHSNVVRETEKRQGADEEDLAEICEFSRESWDYPIVVSTLVQLLDILFSNRTSAAGRMRALCDSVIVIDEVQSLPKKTTVMFNMALNFLQQYCNASIILSSATQPCFEELKWPLHLAEDPDIVKLDQSQLQVFRRTEIKNQVDAYGMDYEQCAVFCSGQMERYTSLLVICNTKAEARRLYEKLQEQAEGWDIYHLSTAMCQKHRMEVLKELKEKLAVLQKAAQEKREVQKIVCISTQLIEAGVDLSFECVIRVLAGVDNLAQAAGRCNRSNEYGQTGKVYLVNLKNENLSMLREIKNAQDSTRRVIENWDDENGSLIEEKATGLFYRYLFGEIESEMRYPFKDCGSTIYLADLLSNKNGSAQKEENRGFVLHQPFKTVGRIFKVFDERTTDVLVPYGDGQQWIDELKKLQHRGVEWEKFGEIMQHVKKYTVSVFEWQQKKLDQAGMLERLLDGRILALSGQAYNDNFGLTVLEEQPVENYVL